MCVCVRGGPVLVAGGWMGVYKNSLFVKVMEILRSSFTIISVFIYLSIYLSIYLPIYLSIYLYIYLYIYEIPSIYTMYLPNDSEKIGLVLLAWLLCLWFCQYRINVTDILFWGRRVIYGDGRIEGDGMMMVLTVVTLMMIDCVAS